MAEPIKPGDRVRYTDAFLANTAPIAKGNLSALRGTVERVDPNPFSALVRWDGARDAPLPVSLSALERAEEPAPRPSEDRLRAVAERLLKKAALAKADAGYSGSWSDGGASRIEAEVACFLAGLDKRLPPGWEAEAKAAEREADPEFAEYRRLQRKFGGAKP